MQADRCLGAGNTAPTYFDHMLYCVDKYDGDELDELSKSQDGAIMVGD